MPPTYFLVLLVMAIGAYFIFPVGFLIYSPFTYAGLGLILFGIVLNLWASGMFSQRKTPISPFGTPTALMVGGPFRISRNPIYLGMLAILLGVSVFLGAVSTFLFPVLFYLVIRLTFIPMEEQKMERIFGDDYLRYRRKVRRWI